MDERTPGNDSVTAHDARYRKSPPCRWIASLLTLLAAAALSVSEAPAQTTSAPAVSGVSISGSPASGSTYERGEKIYVRVDFDQPVTHTGNSYVALSIGTQTRSATYAYTPGHTALMFAYVVQAEDRDPDGIGIAANAIRLDGGSITATDDATIDAVLTHSAVAAGAGHKVDGSRFVVPSVSSVSFVGSPANGDTYQLGETIELRVRFDRFIDPSGRPRLALTIGRETRLARYDFARGTGGITDIHFKYVVQAADRDTDGISIPADAIRLNGGSIKAGADGTTAATLTHAAVAADASRKVSGSLVTAPSVTRVYFVGSPANASTYRAGETIQVQVNFDRLVTVTGSPQVELTIGSRTRSATMTSYGINVWVLGFRYTVQASDRDPDGISIAANAIRLNGGTITATDGTTDAELRHAAVAADPLRAVGESQVTGPVVTFVYFSSSPASGNYYRAGETIEVTVRFNQAVAVTGSPQVALSVGSHTRLATWSAAATATEIQFRYTVQGTDLDPDGIGIAADNAIRLNGGTIKDAGGTTDAVLTYTHTGRRNDERRRVDGKRTAPAVSRIYFSGSPAVGNTYERGETIEVRVEFDRPVTVTGSPRVALSIGSRSRAATFSSSNLGITAHFAYTVQQADVDADGIGIAANALSLDGGTIAAAADPAMDAVLTHAAVAADGTRRVDGSRDATPAVTGVSFAGAAPAGDSYRPGQTIRVQVAFSRPVTVTGSPRVDLTIGSATRAAAFFSVGGAGTTATFEYTVASADADADGISIAANALSLDGGTIKGADGVTDAVLTHAAVARDPRRKVGSPPQGTGPAVSRMFFSSYPADGDTYQFGEAIRVEVVFDRPVTVTGSPRVDLTIGSATRAASFASGAGSDVTALSFEYLVQAADRDTDGISIAANALGLAGGTIRAADGAADAVLAHAALAADTSRKVDGGRVSAPTVSGISFSSDPESGDRYELGETIRVTVRFDRPVTATGTPRVELTIGTRSRSATWYSSFGTHLFFAYRVQADDLDDDGIAIAANAIRLDGGTIKATAADATDAELAHGPVSVTDRVDGGRVTAPAVTNVAFSGSRPAGGTYGRGDTIRVVVWFDRAVTVTGSPQLVLTVGGQTRSATYAPSSTSSWGERGVAFEYAVRTQDADRDGISIAANALSLNGGAITAVDGTTSANLDHRPVAASASRKVDGSRVRAPAVSAIAFSGLPARGGTYERGETIEVTVEFDKPVTVAGSPRVELTIGSRTRDAAFASAARSGITTLAFRYTVWRGDRDADGVGIAANAIRLDGGSIRAAIDGATDADLGHAAVAPDSGRKVAGGQVSAPVVSTISFSGLPADGATYELGESIRVAVEFDRPVLVTGTPRVPITIGGSMRPAAYVSSSERVLAFAYTVRAQDADRDGISIAANALRLDGGSITAAVDAATAADLGHAALAPDAGRNVDGSRVTAPAVSAVSFDGRPVGGATYVRGETIRVQAAFTRSVTVNGSPRMALLIGGTTRSAAFVSADPGGTALYFDYTVQAADLDPDGIAVAADAVRLDGATIRAGDGVTDATLTHAAVAADATRKVDGRITGPVVSGISFATAPLSGDTYQRGENIDLQVTFNQPVTLTGNPYLALSIGSRTRPATLAYFPGPAALVFRYVVQAGDLDPDGVSIAANAIRPGGGSIKAADGITDAILAHAPVVADARRKVNGDQVTAPAVRAISFIGSPTSGDTYQLGETIEIKVEFDRYVTWSGRLRLALNVGGQTRLARLTYGRGSGGVTDLHFGYAVQDLDFDADGISIGADAIRLDGASITARDRTTDADLTHPAVGNDVTRKVDGIEVTGPALTRISFLGVPASGDAYQRGETIQVQAWFDRLVTVSGTPEVELTIGSRSVRATFTTYGVGVQGLGFRYTVQARDADADGIGIAANAIRLNGGSITAAGGSAPARLTHAAVVDDLTRKVGRATAPVAETAVSSMFVSSVPASGDTYERGETIDLRVVFNRSVRVTGSPQVELMIGGAVRAAAFSGTHYGRTLAFRYPVQAADRDSDGIAIAANAIRLDGGSIKAADGVTDAVLTHAALPADPGRKVDGSQVTAPQVAGLAIVSRPRTGTTYGRGEAIVVEVGFSEPVTVTGAPELALAVGSATRSAAFVRSAERSLWFRYRVRTLDRDDDGIGIAAPALTLNGGSIRDRTGNDAQLDLGSYALTAAAGHHVDAALVDTVAPTVVGVALSSAPRNGSTWVLGETVAIEVRFSEPVTVTGAPRLTLQVGSDRRSAGYHSSRQQLVRFRYVVQAGDRGALRLGADALSLNGGTILDPSANRAVLRLGSADLTFDYRASGVVPDEDPPTATSVRFESSPASGDRYGRGDVIQVAVRFDEPVTVTGTPQLALAIGSATRRAAFSSAEQEYVRFRYTVQEQDRDRDGIGVAAAGLSLNGGTIVDDAGNPAQLDLAAAAIGSGDPVDGSEKTETVATRAAVTSRPHRGDTYGRGESVDVEVQFNKQVTVTGRPLLELTLGSAASQGAARSGRLNAAQTGAAAPAKRRAALVSAVGDRLHFRYVVQAQDRSHGGGIAIAADALRLNGARITDAAGEPVAAKNLRLDNAEVVHGDLVDAAVSEPAVADRVAVVSEPQADRTYRLGEAIVIDVRFSRGVQVTGQPQLELAIDRRDARDAAPRRASFLSADHDTVRFRYPVQAGDRDDDGIGIPAQALSLNGGTISDSLGEAAELGLERAQIAVPADKVDGQSVERTPPVVESVAVVSQPPAGGYGAADRISVAVTFSETVVVAGSPRLELHLDGAVRLADYAAAAGAARATLKFVYTVQVGDRAPGGIGIPADALRLNGAKIRDGAGNDADLRSSEVPPAARHAVLPDVRIGCKPTTPAGGGTMAAAAGRAPGSAPGDAPRAARSALPNYDRELVLELQENRDGSEHPVVLGCVALAAAGRQFSYALTAGNDAARFAVGAADGLLRYVGSGENHEQTAEYLLTVSATPADGGAVLTLQVRVTIVDGNDPGLVTLSTRRPLPGEAVTATLTDQDAQVRDARWQWLRQASDGGWSDIADATAARYTPVAADAGHFLQAQVTYADEHGVQRAASRPTEAVDLDTKRRERMLQLGLARFGRTVAATVVRVVGQRFVSASPAHGESDGWHLEATLNRRALHPAGGDLARSVAEALGVQVTGAGAVDFVPVPGGRLLSDSAFSMERGHGPGRLGLWGSGDLSGFGGDVDGFRQDATVVAGYLGVDYRFVPNALAGLAASYSSLDLTSESTAAGAGTLRGYLVNAHPYAFWMPAEWLGVWGVAGLGIGTAELEDAGARRNGAVRMWMGAIGQRSDLLSGGGLSLAVRSDGFITGLSTGDGLPVTDANAWRARLLLEGGLELRPGDSRLAGSLAVGARLDGGDAESGFGADAAAELSYAHVGSGLGLAGSGRLLLLHEAAGIRDWGASATLSWQPPGIGSGLAVSVAPRWGEPASGVLRSSWLPDAVALKVGYGFDLQQGAGRLAPFATIEFADAAPPSYQLGVGGALEY